MDILKYGIFHGIQMAGCVESIAKTPGKRSEQPWMFLGKLDHVCIC